MSRFLQNETSLINPDDFKIAQDKITNELYSNQNDLQDQIQELSQKSSNLNEQIIYYQNILAKLLSKKHSEKSINFSSIIKDTLLDFEIQILSLAKDASQSEHCSIPITAIFDLENQLDSIIDNLIDQNNFPETPEETERRQAVQNSHSERVLSFISTYLHDSH